MRRRGAVGTSGGKLGGHRRLAHTLLALDRVRVDWRVCRHRWPKLDSRNLGKAAVLRVDHPGRRWRNAPARAVAGFCIRWTGRRRDYVVLVAGVLGNLEYALPLSGLFVPIFLALLISTVRPMVIPRYFIVCLPALILVASSVIAHPRLLINRISAVDPVTSAAALVATSALATMSYTATFRERTGGASPATWRLDGRPEMECCSMSRGWRPSSTSTAIG